jgi:hypothetical protein
MHIYYSFLKEFLKDQGFRNINPPEANSNFSCTAASGNQRLDVEFVSQTKVNLSIINLKGQDQNIVGFTKKDILISKCYNEITSFVRIFLLTEGHNDVAQLSENS